MLGCGFATHIDFYKKSRHPPLKRMVGNFMICKASVYYKWCFLNFFIGTPKPTTNVVSRLASVFWINPCKMYNNVLRFCSLLHKHVYYKMKFHFKPICIMIVVRILLLASRILTTGKDLVMKPILSPLALIIGGLICKKAAS